MNKWSSQQTSNYDRDNVLAHLTGNISEDDRNELIKILLVNRNVMIMIDSDKRYKADRLNNTKQRIRQEMEGIGSICWITKGKEVENYIPQASIAGLYNKDSVRQINKYQSFDQYLDIIDEGEGQKFLSNKVLFAERVCPLLTKDNLTSVLDIKERLDEVCNCIRRWNALGVSN